MKTHGTSYNAVVTRPHVHRDDRGSITAFVASFTIALLTVAGLVIDGGFTLAARRRAFNEANAAARAGAQAIDGATLRARGEVRLHPGRARRLALDHLATSGLVGTVHIAGDTVTVHVSTSQELTVLRIVGLRPLPINAAGTARAAKGPSSGGA